MVIFRIFRGSSTQRPYLLTKSANRFLHIFLIFTGIEQDGLKGGSFAFENILINIIQIHDGLENIHPSLKIILKFRMQILIV
jgi:hypothetical protein